MKHITPRFLTTTEGRFFATVTVIIIALFSYYFYVGTPSASNDIADIQVSQTDHVRGAKDGKVTLVEFGDFQCPACGAYEPIVKQVVADNKDTLKIVYRHFPLTQIHKNALPAALATEAAGLQGKFWEMHDILYAKQDEWSGSLNAQDLFVMYATTLELDVQKFKNDLSSKTLEDKILSEFKEGVRLGVQGTPTFFLNGKKLENPIDLAKFNALVKEAATVKVAPQSATTSKTVK